MTIIFRQVASNALISVGSISASFGGASLNKSLLLAVVCNDTAKTTSVISDNIGNTYTKVDSASSTTEYCDLWYCQNAAAAVTAITATVTVASNPGLLIYEYTGILAAGALDKHVIATSASAVSPASSGATAATTLANELVFGYGSSAVGSMSNGTGYGNLQGVGPSLPTFGVYGFSEDKIVMITGAQTATFTYAGSQSWVTGVATFGGIGGAVKDIIKRGGIVPFSR